MCPSLEENGTTPRASRRRAVEEELNDIFNHRPLLPFPDSPTETKGR